MESGINLQNVKLSRYNLIMISVILVVSQLILGGFILIGNSYFKIKLEPIWIILLSFFVLQLAALMVYEKLNTERIKTSFGRFIQQIKLGNYESEESHIIQKYDFVNITDIQVELSELVGQIQVDYNEQKRYIENVSHELMTPIAIIRGKLELLIQSENITKSDFKLISQIMLKLDRLTRVNQSLVLLSKIDYNHYQDKAMISFNNILDETLNLFEDQIRVDELLIRKDIKEDIRFNMNENLAYILIKNIIKNAVIHNIEKGYIRIKKLEDGNGIQIINSGLVIHSSTDQLFKRFQVEGGYQDSIGLGLSIIAKICEISGLKLTYTHNEGVHTVTIRF